MEKLNDNELFNVYQQTKQDFKNAIEGSKEENNSHDKLILISNEMDRRIFDLKKHMKEKKNKVKEIIRNKIKIVN